MRALADTKSSFLDLDRLDPIRVLDDLDGPRLFTVRDKHGLELLAYQCGEDDEVERFLLVPADARLVEGLEENRITLRDALTRQGCAWLVDVHRDARAGAPVPVDVNNLPDTALPRPGLFLAPGR